MAVEEALTSLLSGVAGGKRYWGRGENVSGNDTYLVLNKISAPRTYLLGGPETYIAARFQIDAYGPTYRAARTAADAATAALSGYDGTVADARILGIFVESERDLSAADAGEVAHLFRRSIDVIVHHHE